MAGDPPQSFARHTALVARTFDVLDGVVDASPLDQDPERGVSQLAGAVQQTAGIGQVSQAVSALDHVTQQNAALVEESAAAAQSMRRQAARLVDAVAVFRVADAEAARAG